MGTNDYQTPGVYAPAVTGVIHQTPRDRHEIDPDSNSADKGSAKATEVPSSQAVRKAEGGAESGVKDSGLESKSERSSVPDPASLVRAQELARETEKTERQEREKRSAVASPSEMVGAPEDLVRLDQNRDGRIDQLEVQHSIRAEAEDTTYAALSHYRKTMGFGTVSEDKDKSAEEQKKLFAEEIAKADKEKLSEAAEPERFTRDRTDTGQGEGDSSEAAPKPENGVEIVV